MAQAEATSASRRTFSKWLFAAGSAAFAATPAVALSPPAQDDNAILALAEQILEENMAGHAYDAEDDRLREIWGKENHRLHDEVEAGRLSLTIAERNALIEAMPEYQETMRLYDLKWSHLSKMDELIRQMWAISAHTPEGRAAKVWVLLACVMDPEQGWGERDGHYRSDESVEQARALLIEFVGAEPGQALREQFA